MNIAVVLKQVPDTEAIIFADPTNPGKIKEDDVKFILNPYDEFAIEEALTITEDGDGEVIGVCIGPEKAETAIRTALAMGVNRAIHISDDVAVNADVVSQGEILAAAIKGQNVSMVLVGREMIDTQDDALAAVIAYALDMPHVMNAGKIEIDGDAVKVTRENEGGSLEVGASFPVVVSCQKGLNDPRYPTLIAIKRSKRKEIKKVTLGELGIQLNSPKSRCVGLVTPPPRAEGIKVDGEPADVVSRCITWLADEAKLI